MIIKEKDLKKFLRGEERDPHRVLGIHRYGEAEKGGWVVVPP